MPADRCPTSDVLKQHALGFLSDDESSSIDSHLANCSQCAHTLAGFDTNEDTLVAQLSGTRPSKEAYDVQLRRALANIKLNDEESSLTSLEHWASPDVVPLATSLREYQLLERLGTGGMGDVYKARHVKLDRIVAVKVLHSERLRDASAVARFEREIRAVGKFEHPNIVRATDAGEEDGRHFLVMEYVDGLDMADVVRRVGQLPVADACEIVRQAAIGLEHVHHHGLVHRDIKPSNLMLTGASSINLFATSGEPARSTGVVKVLDLGLALLNDTGHSAAGELTHSGMIIGTLDYMAPEQGTDTHQVDIRADIYSLGATLYKLLVAEAPFSGGGYDRPLRKLAAITNELPPSLIERRPDVPPELAAIVNKMLAKSPDGRYSTPAEVADALAPFAIGNNLGALLEKANTRRRRDDRENSSHETIVSSGSNTSKEKKRTDAALVVPMSSPLHVSTSAKPSHQGTSKRESSSWSEFRTRAAIAGGLLLLAAVLVFRIMTDHGELVVKSNDPNVSFKIERIEGGTPLDLGDISWDQGQKRALIPSGDYLVTLDGVNADNFQITDADQDGTKKITLGRGKEVIVSIEQTPARQNTAAVATVEATTATPFVVQQADGKVLSEWSTLAEAILASNNANTAVIEVRGDGPFAVPPLHVTAETLRIRAAAGYRPDFRPARNVTPTPVLISTDATAIEIEGCSWSGFGGALFSSQAPELKPWAFRGCHFIGTAPVRAYSGPSLLFENCLLSGVGSVAELGGSAKLDFHNNIVRGQSGFGLGRGGQKLSIVDNTIYLDGYLFTASFIEGSTTEITFERNVVNSGPILSVGSNLKLEELRNAIDWRTRDNLYNIGGDIAYRAPNGTFGFYFDRGDGSGVGEVFAPDFAAWKKFWSKEHTVNENATFEQGSFVAEARFEFDEIHSASAEHVIHELRISPETSIAPDWDALGPGDAYFRLLRAEQGSANFERAPAPLESGPIVLLRDGTDAAGFTNLDAAAGQATQPGDVIEIRTNAPCSGCNVRPGAAVRSLTIRAAAGYRPTIQGVVSGAPSVRLSLEGLHLIGVVNGQHAGLRMQNCLASLNATDSRTMPIIAVTIEEADQPIELRNCILTGTVGFATMANPPLVIENSILTHLSLHPRSAEPLTVKIHRSIIWSPLEGLCLSIVNGKANFEVEQTRFVTSVGIYKSAIWNGAMTAWNGKNNFYVVGSDTWSADGPSISNLDAWRKHFHTDEEGSTSYPFGNFLRDWELMPGSPGQGAGPNRKDLGADARRINPRIIE